MNMNKKDDGMIDEYNNEFMPVNTRGKVSNRK